MERKETSWRSSGEWKSRYSKLYSVRRLSLPTEEKGERCISFMSNDGCVVSPLERSSVLGSVDTALSSSGTLSILSHQPALYSSMYSPSNRVSEDLGEQGTLLLNMVRERSRQESKLLNQPLVLSKADEDEKEQNIEMDACFHSGWNARGTERSYSRSRISRISTKRDMDIPSLIAFTTNMQEQVEPVRPIKNLDFQKAKPQEPEVPRWSIRRSVCPVCSQKWRDRSSIKNVKNSGLKRNVSADLTSVIAPARLRTYITLGYAPRPALVAVDEEAGALRTTGPAWQFTRARKFRCIKPTLPPEATAPPSATAPQARKGLDTRLHKFISDLQMDTEDTESRQPTVFELNSPVAFHI